MVRVGVLGVVFGAVVLLVTPVQAGDFDHGPAIWSGFYVGAHAGYAQGDATTTDDIKDWCSPGDTACIKKYVGPFDWSPEGGFGGGTIGVNWQHGMFVVGIEGDLGYMGVTGSRKTDSSNPVKYQTLEVDGGFYGVAAGRLGLAFGRTLVYAKSGWAYYDTNITQTTTNPGFTTHGTDALTGWAYGGGLEHALGQGWSIKAEYLHFQFDSEQGDQTRDDDGYTFGNSSDLDVDTVKLGVNYKFGARDIPAPLK